MPSLILTKEQIIETTGIEKVEEIEDLEILFLTFEELASLENCRRLRRLCCIDNGLRKISNLQPVSSTLQSLCLCDQSISVVENLFLPRLKELFLHRNQITNIVSLSGCPKLQKLWLFQNQLTSASIQSLFQNLPDLEELWLQGNLLTTLVGFNTFPKLRKLALAGNPIRHYEELQYLSSLNYLQDISFNDFHFGRCPIVEDYSQYKSFALLYLKQILILDGVKMTIEQRQHAEGRYYDEMKGFMQELQEIDHDYYKNMKEIELEFQSRESYTVVLEKEMATALKDLHGLVDEGRNVVSKEIQKNKTFIDHNFKSLRGYLEQHEAKAQESIEEQLYLVAENYQMMINILHLLELTDKNHTQLQQTLSAVVLQYQENQQQQQQGTGGDKNRLFMASSKKSLLLEGGGVGGGGAIMSSAPKFAFQHVNNNTAEFHLLACLIDPTMMQVYSVSKGGGEGNSHHHDDSSNGKPTSSSGLPKRSRSTDGPGSTVNTNNKDDKSGGVSSVSSDQLDIPLLELAKLYKIAMYPRPFPVNSSSSEFQRIYCVLSIADLKVLLTQGWRGLKQQYNTSATTNTSSIPNLSYGKVSQVFSNDASLLSHMMVEHDVIQHFNKVPTSAEDPFGSNTGVGSSAYWEQTGDTLTDIMKNIIKHSLQKGPKNNNNGINTPGKKGGAGGAAASAAVPDLLGRVFVFVSFQVSLRQLGLLAQANSQLSPIVTSLQVPALPAQRAQLMKELELSSPPHPSSSSAKESSSKYQADSVGSNSYRVIVARNRNSEELKALHQQLQLIPSSSSNTSPRTEEEGIGQSKHSAGYISGVKPLEQSLLYCLPLDVCDSLLYLDFLALCVSHLPFNSAATASSSSPSKKPPVQLLKHLEAKLLALTMPTTQTDDAAKIITEFETNAKEEVKRYIERLMEGIDESEARELQKSDEEVRYRESSMRHLREEIERERRGQEIQLRELKAYVSSGGAGGGGGSHTNSDTNIGLMANPSNPKLLPSNKNRR